MKKRIGNDIQFTWHIYRKNGDTQTPESFDGKDVEVKLLSPLKQPVTIEDVSIATGVVTFTFRGKHQVTLGNYVAVLQENRGEDGMVTIDVVSAVSLVAHSYMEEDGDDGDVIEAESVELTSTISAGGGDTPIDAYTKAETDELFVKKVFEEQGVNTTYFSPGGMLIVGYDEHGAVRQNSSYSALGWIVYDGTDYIQTFGGTIYKGGIGTPNSTRVIWERTATEQIPVATPEANGLMSAADKQKMDTLPTDGYTAADVSYDNSRTGLSATTVQEAIDEMADTNLYETVVLTIGSADSSFNPVGQTITVTLEDGSATQYTVPMSRQITFIVQIGMRYTISGTSTADYRVLPISVKAAIPTRYLTMRYIPIATGVFILQRDGNYYLRDEYDAETMAEDAVGVLVLTSALINAGFGLIVSKSDTNESVRMQAGNIALTTNDYTHYVGKANTDTIYSQYPNNTFPIINKALAKSITYGEEHTERGYVASYAEGALLLSNATEINTCLVLIGGVGILSNTWSNSYILGTGKSFKNWNNAILNYEQQASTAYNRPIYQYPLS